jgi:hypothetical protein
MLTGKKWNEHKYFPNIFYVHVLFNDIGAHLFNAKLKSVNY